MIKRSLLAALLALCAPPAAGQNAIAQEGTVLQNAPMMFRGNNRAHEGATVSGAPTGQIVTTGDAVVGGRCDYSAPTDAPEGYYRLCLDAKTGTIKFDGTRLPQMPTLKLEVNGQVYELPGSAAVVGSDAAVMTNAVLKTTTGAIGKRLVRLGFAAPGDGGFATYNWWPDNCATADNGAQVQPAGVTGCWMADLSSAKVTPQVWGCVGDGVADDTACVQAAINAMSRLGMPLHFNGDKLYNITETLKVTAPIVMQGMVTYGMWPGNVPDGTGSPQVCPWGLVTKNTGITMLHINAISATVKDLCIDMTANQHIQAISGAAINLRPATNQHYQAGILIEGNTIMQPWDGITLNGHTIIGCCGKGATGDGVLLHRNTIINPNNEGISIGKNTVHAATVGNTLTDNAIVCGKGNLHRGVGIALYDGGMSYDGTQNGPLGCTYGIKITPTGIGTDPQWAQANIDGVIGDQSTVHDLLIKPGNGGWISPISIGGKGPWVNATRNVNSVMIDCTASTQSFCQGIMISGMWAHGGNGQNQSIIAIEAGPGGPWDLSITNSSICQGGIEPPGPNSVALRINMHDNAVYSGNYTISNNHIGLPCLGSGNPTAMGIWLTIGSGIPSGGAIMITGNDFTNTLSKPMVPITYIPASDNRVIVANNMGLDNALYPGAITAAATIQLNNSYTNYYIAGAATITNIVNSSWQGRRVRLFSTGAGINMATSGNICSNPVANAHTVELVWLPSATCWHHIP